MEPLPKLAWFPLYVTELLGSAAWLRMKDYQRGWYIQLLLLSTQSEHPGYLPLDGSLWRLAGARTKQFFDNDAAVVLACFKRRQMDGHEWIYNEHFLQMLEQQSAKIRTREEKRSGKRCRKPDPEQTPSLFSSLCEVGVDYELKQIVEELFEFYRELFCRDSRYTLTDSRRRLCEARLLECLEQNGGDRAAARETARMAIFNLSQSEFHLKHGYFDWCDHLFKTREVFEKRVGMKVAQKPLQPGTRSGAFAEPSSGEDEVLPDWLTSISKRIEVRNASVLAKVQHERDPVKSA